MDQVEIKALKACRKGDLEQFTLFYDKYIKKIYDFVYYKTHHKELAEDLCSQIFIKALNNILKFNEKKGTFQAWIYRIARNTVIDHYRTQKQDKTIDDIWDLSSNENIAKDLDIKIKLEKIEQYIKKLNSKQRDIIIMKLWQGMSHKEIAEVLGSSEASCKMMYLRTMKQLRQDMPYALFFVLVKGIV